MASLGFRATFLLVTICISACTLSSSGGNNELTNGILTVDTHSRFPINAGSKHASTTCNDCHGNYDTFLKFSCIDCHQHEQTGTTTNHATVDGFSYDSQGCFSCHPDGTASGAGINHDTFFPTSAGNRHAGIECASCHLNPNDRTVLGCATDACHSKAATDPNHTAVSGYSYDSASCYGCHPKGIANISASVNHALIFPIAPGATHSVATCSNCHTDPVNRQNVKCVDCHLSDGTTRHSQTASNSQHTQVGGFLWAIGELSFEQLGLFLMCSAGLTWTFSLASLLSFDFTFPVFRLRDLLRLSVVAAVEYLGFRQILSIARFAGTIASFFGYKAWDKFERERKLTPAAA